MDDPSPDLAVRPFAPGDAEAVSGMIAALAAFHGKAAAVTASDLVRRASGPGRISTVWTALLDGGPCGFAAPYDWMNDVGGFPVRNIDLMFVREAARGRGVGLPARHRRRRARQRGGERILREDGLRAPPPRRPALRGLGRRPRPARRGMSGAAPARGAWLDRAARPGLLALVTRGSVVHPYPAALDALLAPPPALDEREARAVLRERYGVAARLSPLPGERDRNALVEMGDGTRAVLKLYGPAEPPASRALGRAALLHLEARRPPFAVPRLVRARDGAETVAIGGAEAAMTSFVPGAPWGAQPPGAATRRAVGAAAAALHRALDGFDPPAARRTLAWDLMALGRLAPVAAAVADRRRGDALAALVERFEREVRPAAEALPAGAVHNDLNGDNVLFADGAVAGVIDFGDLLRAPRAVEVAVAANYGHGAADLAEAAADVAEGWAAVEPLLRAEAGLLFDLALGRLALRCLIYEWRAAREPAGYGSRNAAAGFAALDRALALPPGAGRARVTMRLADAGLLR